MIQSFIFLLEFFIYDIYNRIEKRYGGFIMAKQYKKILVPLDGSKQSYDALHEAEMIADWSDAELILLTVRERAKFYGLAGANVGITELTESEKISHDIISKASGMISSGIKVIKEELFGSPKREVVRYAKENSVDLIVMGSTGAGLVDEILVGSTTHYVVNNAPCRVTIVP